jgi:hypothetical protein
MFRKRIKNLFFRVSRQAHICACDAQRWWLWHFGGGKKYYSTHYREIIAKHKWVFIVGCNNSGTTLLQKALEKCGQVSAMQYEGQRHTTMLPRAYKYGYDRVWSEYAEDLQLSSSRAACLMPRLVHDWFMALSKPVKPVIVEKTPANVLRMDFLNKHFPEAYFIGLVRNGYAVTEGIKRKSGHSVERAARHWGQVGEILKENSQKVENYLEVRYEDLAGNLTACAANLADFLGLDADAISDVQNETFSLDTVAGNSHQSIKNLNRESIDRLNKNEIEIIFKHAGPMLDHYEYTADLATEKR